MRLVQMKFGQIVNMECFSYVDYEFKDEERPYFEINLTITDGKVFRICDFPRDFEGYHFKNPSQDDDDLLNFIQILVWKMTHDYDHDFEDDFDSIDTLKRECWDRFLKDKGVDTFIQTPEYLEFKKMVDERYEKELKKKESQNEIY